MTNCNYSGEFRDRLICDFIFIRLQFEGNYENFFNNDLPTLSHEIEIIKQLLNSNFKINLITKQSTIKLVNGKLEIHY